MGLAALTLGCGSSGKAKGDGAAGSSGDAGTAGITGGAGTGGTTGGAGGDPNAGGGTGGNDGSVDAGTTGGSGGMIDAGTDAADAPGEAGGCASLASDTSCGACGRDCTIDGSKCTLGACESVQLFSAADMPFGTDNGGARSWAFDPTAATAYWVGFNNYSVRAYPFDGSGAKVIWTPATAATAGTESIAVTGGKIYWSVGATIAPAAPPAVLTKAATDAATVAPTIAFNPTARAAFLRVLGDSFYWTTGDYQDPTAPTTGYVYKRAIAAVSSDGGTAIVTVDQGNFAGFKAFQPTSNALYWISDSTTNNGTPYELRTTPLAGGTPTAVPKIAGAASTVVAAYGGVTPTLYAVGATIYFTRALEAGTLNGIYRFATGDAAPTQVVSAEQVTSFLVDDMSVYYVRLNSNDVYKAPLAGGSAALIAHAIGTKLVGQDAKYLYLLQSGSGTSTLAKLIK